MKVEDYIKKKIILSGHGQISEEKLDKQFFSAQEKEFGKIKDVYPIKDSIGGIVFNAFKDNPLMGCLISFENGKEMVIESDGEYIDWFVVDKSTRD